MHIAELLESFLEQSPACQWIVRARAHVSSAFYGDSDGRVFGVGRPGELRSAAGLRQECWLPAERRALWREPLARGRSAGETLLLRERRGEDVWYVSAISPMRRDEGEMRSPAGWRAKSRRWSAAEQELRHTVLGALKRRNSNAPWSPSSCTIRWGRT